MCSAYFFNQSGIISPANMQASVLSIHTLDAGYRSMRSLLAGLSNPLFPAARAPTPGQRIIHFTKHTEYANEQICKHPSFVCQSILSLDAGCRIDLPHSTSYNLPNHKSRSGLKHRLTWRNLRGRVNAFRQVSNILMPIPDRR